MPPPPETPPSGRSWPVAIWASSARTWPPDGAGRPCETRSTTPRRRCSSSASARAGCSTPRGTAASPASGPSCTGSSATSPAGSRAGPPRPSGPLPDVAADDPTQSRLFDRTWARAIMAEAGRLQRARAEERGPEAVGRVELLRLRFEENLPIREIALRWATDPATVHKSYALARKEFRQALLEVVAFHHPGSAVELEEEAASLLKALS